MTELIGLPLSQLYKSIINEYKYSKSIFNYPERNIFRGFDDVDLSVHLYNRSAFTPVGPAAGPHTQMAQNIILSFLAGARIIELKTIQILDDLSISRPCIDMRNIGYNVEWSQELSLQDSLNEYVKAWMLLRILRAEETLGIHKQNPFYDTIFDISVGYDLNSIRSEPVSNWIAGIKDARQIMQKMLDELPAELDHLKEIEFPSQISDSVTLSTFHGCPSDEIESIVKYLINEHGLHVIVKMNPTILGLDTVEHLLIEQMGYTNIQLDAEAFGNDLSMQDAVEMMTRLDQFAKKHNRIVGAKFTNTLVVKNTENIFNESLRYLSGPPLYVLAMSAVSEFRKQSGLNIPLSFSGGIDKNNFSQAIGFDLCPVTTCTDLLKKGGYSRLPGYLSELRASMLEISEKTITSFVQKTGYRTFGQNALKQIRQDKRYYYSTNSNLPKKIESELEFFDCLSCNICIPVCPNQANFDYEIVDTSILTGLIRLGKSKIISDDRIIHQLKKKTQIGNVAEFCNACGNCDTFCPESGGPHLAKPTFYFTPDKFMQHRVDRSYYFKSEHELQTFTNDDLNEMQHLPKSNEYLWQNSEVQVRLDNQLQVIDYKISASDSQAYNIDLESISILYILLKSLPANQSRFPFSLIN